MLRLAETESLFSNFCLGVTALSTQIDISMLLGREAVPNNVVPTKTCRSLPVPAQESDSVHRCLRRSTPACCRDVKLPANTALTTKTFRSLPKKQDPIAVSSCRASTLLDSLQSATWRGTGPTLTAAAVGTGNKGLDPGWPHRWPSGKVPVSRAGELRIEPRFPGRVITATFSFSAFPCYISGVHHFWVRFLSM